MGFPHSGRVASYPGNFRLFSSSTELPPYPGEMQGPISGTMDNGYRLGKATNGRSTQQSQAECRKD